MTMALRSASTGPGALTVVTVQERHRLRIKHEFFAGRVEWLAPDLGSVSCFGLVGRKGVFTVAHDAELLQTEIVDTLNRMTVGQEQLGSAAADFARLSSAIWEMTFSYEQQERRWSATLPRDARHLDLIPSAGARAAVFIVNGIIEIWPAGDFLDFLKRAAQDVDRLIDGLV